MGGRQCKFSLPKRPVWLAAAVELALFRRVAMDVTAGKH
jgi:hypothetical protein